MFVNQDVQGVELWSCAFTSRAAAMTLRTVLLSLQALLAAAEPDDPQDAVVANQVGYAFVCLSMVLRLQSWFKMMNKSHAADLKLKKLYFGVTALCESFCTIRVQSLYVFCPDAQH